MAGNTIGRLFAVTSFGESHGAALGCVVDGCPPGLELTEADLQADVDRRRPGTSQFTSQRREPDTVRILSGVFEGRTTGTPIGLLVANEDQRSRDYDKIKDRFRPGHADYTYQQKYGFRDYRGGGRSSARETVVRVAAGAIARKFLRERLNIIIHGYLAQMGPIVLQPVNPQAAYENPFFCPDPSRVQELEDFIWRLREAGDSIGARVTVIAKGVPPGWGEPVFERLDADLASAMMGINAVKGVEIGAGFKSVRTARLRASRRNDAAGVQEQPCRRRSRRHFFGPGHHREPCLEANLQHHAARSDHRHSRRAGRDRNHRTPRSLRRLSRDADCRGDVGAGLDGPLSALSRAVRRRGLNHTRHHAAMMSRSATPRIAVVGVSTLIGEAVIDELRARQMPFAELHALDDERHLGTRLPEEEAKLPVGDVAAFDFSRVDLVFFCGRVALSERYAEKAAELAWVIDGSAAFRARADVPLVAADVNPQVLDAVGAHGLVALPGSASVALATALEAPARACRPDARRGSHLSGGIGQRPRRHG